ncbi:glucose repression regulatory protein TUP1 [Pelomyxa schiedti]|nr:glucose repression regulatory protein TUP1 [Pelomyxa schiedti]
MKSIRGTGGIGNGLETLDLLRQEYETLLQDLSCFKAQRDELEKQLQQQSQEYSSLQSHMKAIEATHNQQRLLWEEEKAKLKRAVEQHIYQQVQQMQQQQTQQSRQTLTTSGSNFLTPPSPSSVSSLIQPQPAQTPSTTVKTSAPSSSSPDWTVSYNQPNGSSGGPLRVDLLHTFSHTEVVCCAALSDDARFVAAGSGRSLYIYDVESGKQVQTITITGDDKLIGCTRSVSFSPSATHIAAVLEDYIVRVWDLSNVGNGASNTPVCMLQPHNTYPVAWLPSGKILAACNRNELKLWEIETQKVSMSLLASETANQCTSIAIAQSGNLIAASFADSSPTIWDLRTGNVLDTLDGHADSVYCVAFSHDGTKLASASIDKNVKLWAVRIPNSSTPSQCIATLSGHKDFVLTCTFIHESRYIVTGGKDRTIQVWDTQQPVPTQVLTIHGHSNVVLSVSTGKEGGVFVSGSGDSKARVWKLIAGS